MGKHLYSSVHRKALSESEFPCNRRCESHSVLRSVDVFLVLSSKFCPIWVKFRTRDLNVIPLSSCVSCENRHRKCRTFLTGVNKIEFNEFHGTV